ncbi:MAG: hypothetical protein ABEJ35_07075 [Halobacteriaceae archaeon]
MEHDTLEERLRAVERTVADEQTDAEVPGLEERVSDIERKLQELEAATETLRAYVGDIRARDDHAERRADADLAEIGQYSPEPRRQRSRQGPIDTGQPPRRNPERSNSSEADGLLDRMAAWL